MKWKRKEGDKQYNGKEEPQEEKVNDKENICLCIYIDTSVFGVGLLLAAGYEICDVA